MITAKLNEDRLMEDLLMTAIEGGSNYWYQIEDGLIPPEGERHYPDRDVIETPWYVKAAMTEGGRLIVTVPEDEAGTERSKHTLTYEKLKTGLELMRTTQPRHYGDALKENADATTGDVFLQLALLGEIVFG